MISLFRAEELLSQIFLRTRLKQWHKHKESMYVVLTATFFGKSWDARETDLKEMDFPQRHWLESQCLCPGPAGGKT